MAPDEETTLLLRRMAEGDAGAGAELYELLYQDLHRRAQALMGRQAPDHTLQATALVNEAWLRLAGHDREWKDRVHFLRVASRAMRYVLVDHARARSTAKRSGGEVPLPEEGIELDGQEPSLTLLAVHEALERLERVDGALFQVAELRLFGGLTHREIGRVLDVSSRSVDRCWKAARAWIQREMDASGAE